MMITDDHRITKKIIPAPGAIQKQGCSSRHVLHSGYVAFTVALENSQLDSTL